MVGKRTLGKGTVEQVVELANGWGLKLSVGKFVPPSGESFLGVGLTPDFEIEGSSELSPVFLSDAQLEEDDIRGDSQLKAALRILNMDS